MLQSFHVVFWVYPQCVLQSTTDIKMLSEDYKTVATGDSVTLSCSVKNYTAVTLKWYKGKFYKGVLASD